MELSDFEKEIINDIHGPYVINECGHPIRINVLSCSNCKELEMCDLIVNHKTEALKCPNGLK